MKVDVLLGLQWGDEGKGKVVDVLTPNYDLITRFQGGPNAGHTLEFEGKKFVLRSIPSGIFQGDKVNIIGNGVVLDPALFKAEVDALEASGHPLTERLKISKKAHLILPTHRLLDAAYESAKGNSKIGTTGKGIGPTYTDKVSRNGVRVGDKFPIAIMRWNSCRSRRLRRRIFRGWPKRSSSGRRRNSASCACRTAIRQVRRSCRRRRTRMRPNWCGPRQAA